MNADTLMTRTRTRLLLDQPWFGSLAMRLDLIEDASIPTMATNGSEIRYNPEFVLKQTRDHLFGIMAHEVLHCALLHPYRRGSREPQRWNIATDHVINLQLRAAGFSLPDDALADPKYTGLNADVVFAQLGDEPQDDGTPKSTGTCDDAPKQQPGAPQPDPNAQPGDQPGQQPAEGQGMTEEDWQIAAEQASNITRAAGRLPGSAAEAAKAASQQPQDWRAILREFIEQTQPHDYSWSVPNRRFIADGLYLPGMIKENFPRFIFVTDSSSSVTNEAIKAGVAEVQEIVRELRPERLLVISCDTRVRSTQEFTADDFEITLNVTGRGGTAFQPAFDWIAAQEDEPPAALMYFTDLENGGERVTEPDYPVLWVTGKNVTKNGPFGQTVRIDAHV